MIKFIYKLLSICVLLLAMGHAVADNIVVIGNSNLSKVDADTISKIFTGKVIEVGGVNVVAVNVIPGSLRNQFLQSFLKQTDEKYVAYWTVRRYIGKGAPPRELRSAADVINFVQSTPGAIGYIDEKDLKPGINVLVRRKDVASSLYFIDYADAAPGSIVYLDTKRPGFNLMAVADSSAQNMLDAATYGPVLRREVQMLLASSGN